MKRLVLKVGSAVLTESNALSVERMKNLAEFISLLMKQYEVILVSSGAVAAGYTKLKLDKKEVSNKQALAAIGQPLLMGSYRKKFEQFDVVVGQVLLTADDFDSRKRTEHAKNAIDVMIKNGVLPIINENDVTATEELVFGDNDQLSSRACLYFGADILVILTDIDGYYDKDPREFLDAKLQKVVNVINPEHLNTTPKANSNFATGGIVTKLKAADFLLKHNLQTYLGSGFDLSDVKSFFLDGVHKKGTLFIPKLNS
ncbi:MAG: glutamate 5-kinase [Campylobacterales bacterium]|nr:glutamate 5-kinase [Campylobacterales bacterium]